MKLEFFCSPRYNTSPFREFSKYLGYRYNKGSVLKLQVIPFLGDLAIFSFPVLKVSYNHVKSVPRSGLTRAIDGLFKGLGFRPKFRVFIKGFLGKNRFLLEKNASAGEPYC